MCSLYWNNSAAMFKIEIISFCGVLVRRKYTNNKRVDSMTFAIYSYSAAARAHASGPRVGVASCVPRYVWLTPGSLQEERSSREGPLKLTLRQQRPLRSFKKLGQDESYVLPRDTKQGEMQPCLCPTTS
jgi:hypothetical protein